MGEPKLLSSGVQRIAAERERQIAKEGWLPEHDDEHGDGDLSLAAACYAACASGEPVYAKRENGGSVSFVDPWPWDRWDDKRPRKPTHQQRIRLLEKAGALCAAEIDRLIREGARPREGKEPRR